MLSKACPWCFKVPPTSVGCCLCFGTEPLCSFPGSSSHPLCNSLPVCALACSFCLRLSLSGSSETVCSLYFAVALAFPLGRLQYETEKERDSLACHALIWPLLLWTNHPSTSSSKTPNYCNIKEQMQSVRVNIKGIVQIKMNVLSLFTHPHVFQTHLMFFSGARKVKNIYAAFFSMQFIVTMSVKLQKHQNS